MKLFPKGEVLHREVRGGEDETIRRASTLRPGEDDRVWDPSSGEAEGKENVRPDGEPVQEVLRNGGEDEGDHRYESACFS